MKRREESTAIHSSSEAGEATMKLAASTSSPSAILAQPLLQRPAPVSSALTPSSSLLDATAYLSSLAASAAALAGSGGSAPAQHSTTASLVPERFVTANSGFEILGTSWDVYAEEDCGPAPEFIEHEIAAGYRRRHGVLSTTLGSAIGSYLRPNSSASAFGAHYSGSSTSTGTVPVDGTDAASEQALYDNGGWYMGWRVEYALDTNELAALRKIVTTNGSQLPSTPDVDVVALIKKLHAGATSVSAHADRFHAQTQQAYGHDIPQLRSRVIALERSQHETNIRHKSIMDAVNQQATAARDRLYEADRHRNEDEALREQQSRELEVVRKQREQLAHVFKQIRDVLICPICTEVAVLPKVVGACGHLACQSCLKTLDDVAFSSLLSAGGGASARQHLMSRRCPLCRTEIIGAGFPVLPLKEIASILIENGCIEVSEMASVQKQLGDKTITYEKPSAEQQHIIDLQIGSYAQSQLAKHSVDCVVATVTPDQWGAGVYVLFESAVSRIFFETFATTLHGRAGGVNVLVNAQQRMLACQLLEKKPKSKTDAEIKKAQDEGNLLIKVATDGRFTVSRTPNPKASVTAATVTAAQASSATATQTMSDPVSLSSNASGSAGSSSSGGFSGSASNTASHGTASVSSAAAATATATAATVILPPPPLAAVVASTPPASSSAAAAPASVAGTATASRATAPVSATSNGSAAIISSQNNPMTPSMSHVILTAAKLSQDSRGNSAAGAARVASNSAATAASASSASSASNASSATPTAVINASNAATSAAAAAAASSAASQSSSTQQNNNAKPNVRKGGR